MEGAYDYNAKITQQWGFGTGLSYTTFDYNNLRVDKEHFTKNDVLRVSIDVTNTGKRAGKESVLLFSSDPERNQSGAYIKIGYFGKSDSDLVYQDEVHGPLIEQVDKTVDLVYTKYMKALIAYEGIQRVEQFMFHKDAFREILLNAIVIKIIVAVILFRLVSMKIRYIFGMMARCHLI